MVIKGTLIEKSETEQVTDSFTKREFVVQYAENPEYPELLKFELIQSNCEQLDGVELGSELNVSFNLKGRKWVSPSGEVKYFNSLQAWRVEATGSIGSVPESAPTVAEGSGAEDDLAF